MQRFSLLAASLALACLLQTACGGGGGSDDAGTPATPATPRGTRALPTGSIAVGQTASGFQVTTTVPDVSSVTVLVGDDYQTATPVAVTASGTHQWSGTAAAGASLLVRLTLADGAVIETAPGDFVLH